MLIPKKRPRRASTRVRRPKNVRVYYHQPEGRLMREPTYVPLPGVGFVDVRTNELLIPGSPRSKNRRPLLVLRNESKTPYTVVTGHVVPGTFKRRRGRAVTSKVTLVPKNSQRAARRRLRRLEKRRGIKLGPIAFWD